MPTDDVTARLAAIEQRANAATAGPWEVASWDPHLILPQAWANEEGAPEDRPPFTSFHATRGEDAEFIAHAREDVPWLIGLLRSTLRSTVEALENAGCQFWACDGADVEPVDMKTCRVCWTLRELRAFRRALDAEPVVKPCKGCGCALADHHKLHCENEHCPGCYGGWTCTEHGWVLCGCTYAGGVDPATGEYAS